MKTLYRCDYCKNIYDTEDECIVCECFCETSCKRCVYHRTGFPFDMCAKQKSTEYMIERATVYNICECFKSYEESKHTS